MYQYTYTVSENENENKKKEEKELWKIRTSSWHINVDQIICTNTKWYIVYILCVQVFRKRNSL